jgi:phenylalanyl-tRNA synthetase beta chain
MNISLDWLKEYLPGATDPQAAADSLMRGGLPVEKIEAKGNDTVLDVEVTSNRSDCLSHVGVARELSALQNREFKEPKIVVAEATTPATSVTSVAIDAPAALSALHRPDHPQREDRPEPGLDGPPARSDRRSRD